ncbi:MAG: phosphatase PAP2 family protein [Candidatus Pacearchaeota archaeon]
MKKRPLVILLLLFLVLAVISFLYDSQIIRFAETIRNSSLDYFFLSFTFASNIYIIFFFLTSLFLLKEHKRRWIPPLWVTSLMALAITFILQILIARPRPFQVENISVLQIAFYFMRNNFNTWNFSFPCLQAVLVFSALPILAKEFKRFKWVWFIFACLVAISRVYFGVNYLSDVIAGGLIGVLIGILVVKVEEKHKIGNKIIRSCGLSKR